MTEKEREIDNLVTWFLMVAGFISVIAWGSTTLDFEKRCEDSCAPADSITPLYNFEHTCFCEEGRGKWRRENVR